MDTKSIMELEQKYEMNLYPKRGIALARGEGEFVWDTDGRRYIDCTTGVGVAILGHAHPAVIAAIERQARTLMTCQPPFCHEERGKLEQGLAQLFGGSAKVMLSNSGTEAVEAALKLARRHTKRNGFVAAMNAFHGRSSGSLSLTFKEKYRAPFEPLLGPVARVRFNDAESLKSAVTKDTAAVFLEPVQGEGGVRPAKQEYLRAARDICTDAGALLVLDEVQTGCGRTGKFFAFEHFGIQPDIACLAKGLGGGVPIGAIVAREEVSTFAPLEHGSTFGGNPLACASANAVLDTIAKDGLLEKVTSDGAYAMQKLQGALSSKSCFREVRGMGLMIAVELKVPTREPLAALAQGGVLALPAGEQVIRLLPPFTISRSSLDTVVETLEGALK
ncbi:[LysW]-aminoadipate semialdehyde/glutamate semialdehyde transaminase [uncultured archaeon]|nr:[LysW]-aminoadipate semialdehyde/glutamate semialdehyde transaminase [uncultured archaeon]